MKKKNLKIASQRGVMSLEASILMTVFAIAAIGLAILFTAYLPQTTKMWMVTAAEQLCLAQNGTFDRKRFVNGNCKPQNPNKACCMI